MAPLTSLARLAAAVTVVLLCTTAAASTQSAAKEWLSVLLTAKATGATVQIGIDSCTTKNVIQVQIQ